MTFSGRFASQPRRKVFISYHHKIDQTWFDAFSRSFGDTYEIFYDNSLDGRIRSDDPEYVNRQIREEYINGTSITIVLCGPQTWKRKYVDWEIHSTLHYEHALLGLGLPTAIITDQGKVTVPTRLHQNVETGYAYFVGWTDDPAILRSSIEEAIARRAFTQLIVNSAPKMASNSP